MVTLYAWMKLLQKLNRIRQLLNCLQKRQGILALLQRKERTLPIGGLICKIEVWKGCSYSASSQSTSAAPAAAASGDKSYAAGHPSPAAAKILMKREFLRSRFQEQVLADALLKKMQHKAQQTSGSSRQAPKSGCHLHSVCFWWCAKQAKRKDVFTCAKPLPRRLVSVKNETAMLTTFNEVDMKPVMDLRSSYKDQFKEKYGVGLGFMSFFTKAVCVALKEFPAVNAQLDGDEIVYHDYCDVSIAVSTPRGLVVPVIRNAESLSFDQIEAEVVRLATRGRDGKLSIDEMTGGTFSITNGGVFGSMLSTPILNPPQSAILGMHNIVERAVVNKW